MTAFSGTVKLANLDDFISPSQACIVSLEGQKVEPSPVDRQEAVVSIQQKPVEGGWSQTLPTKSETDAVKISLQDCLACSGCITSAETVLLEHQSIGEFSARLADPNITVVVTLSRQSIAAISVAHQLPPAETSKKLTAFLKRLGAKAVLDIATGKDLALMETAAEFVQRFRADHPKQHSEEEHRGHSGSFCSTSSIQMPSQESSRRPLPSTGRRRNSKALPMLASACPGWVCYAEKTHGEYALPHISTAKSPQAVMGTLVKNFWGARHGLKPDSIYHCAVMPCYDKKLEASRSDFELPGTQIPETDSVLTTVELQQLLEDHKCRLADLEGLAMDTLLGGQVSDLSTFPGGSGGYMEYIFRFAAEQLFGVAVAEGPLPMRVLRNTDLQEVSLEVGGRTVLRFALAYGFRNIQTLLRKLKQGLSPYDYVEIMACPSGCVNGGGQLGQIADKTPQQLISEVDAAYHHPQIERRRPEESQEARQAYEQLIGGPVYSEAARKLLHTQYHKREKTVTASIRDW